MEIPISIKYTAPETLRYPLQECGSQLSVLSKCVVIYIWSWKVSLLKNPIEPP